MKFLFKIILISFLFVAGIIPCHAENKPKPTGVIQEKTETYDIPYLISFKITSNLELAKNTSEGSITIPQGSQIQANIIGFQKERRWHKGGFIICKVVNYTRNSELTDISDRKIYLIARQYEAIDKKEIGKTAAELTATTAASFVVPGIDIAYYFTKGMINKEENATRFKSGVHSTYENSIFWFWLKGKPINITENSTVSFKEITEQRAQKLKSQIEKRDKNQEKIEVKKEEFIEFMSY